MILTKEQQALLDGEQGETMAKVVKTLVMYGEAFGRGANGSYHQPIRPHGHQLRHRCDEAGV